MRSLLPAKDDLEQRRPVWIALSELFLDSDTALLAEPLSQKLSQGPYSVEQLEEILRNEVYPACWTNMWSAAGEWAGFDPRWLEDRILNHRPRLILLWLRFFGMSAEIACQWQEIKSRIDLIRSRRNA